MPDRTETCPYCGAEDCEADWVDVGVGEIQCGPYYCEACGACQIGPNDTPRPLTAREAETDWYEPAHAHQTSGPTYQGTPVDHRTARRLHELGLLDRKPDDRYCKPAELGEHILHHYLGRRPGSWTLIDTVTRFNDGRTCHGTHLPGGKVSTTWTPGVGDPYSAQAID